MKRESARRGGVGGGGEGKEFPPRGRGALPFKYWLGCGHCGEGQSWKDVVREHLTDKPHDITDTVEQIRWPVRSHQNSTGVRSLSSFSIRFFSF